MNITPDLICAVPELTIAVSAMAVLLAGTLWQGTSVIPRALTIIALLAAIVLTSTGDTTGAHYFNGMFAVNSVTQFIKTLLLAGTLATVLLSLDYLKRNEAERQDFYVLLLFSCLGTMLLTSSADLISLYVGIELTTISLYVLAAFHRQDTHSTEAGLKYYILGALSSAMLLYGISLIYGYVGSTHFTAMAQILTATAHPSLGVMFGMVFMLAGLSFKIAAAPFHMWAPDVYEGAPTPVTAFFASVVKLAAIVILLQVMAGPLLGLLPQWQPIIIVLSIASMTVGTFAAVAQNTTKRLLAYSAIGHTGYALMGMAAGTMHGVRGIVIYLAIYIPMVLGSFAVLLSLRHDGKPLNKVDDFAGLAKTQPKLAFAMAAFMFSMVGIPPLAGFFSKFAVFAAAAEAGLYTTAIIGLLMVAVSAYYYLRIVKLMYFNDPVLAHDPVSDPALRLVITLCAAFTILFALFPDPLMGKAGQVAISLMGAIQ